MSKKYNEFMNATIIIVLNIVIALRQLIPTNTEIIGSHTRESKCSYCVLTERGRQVELENI